VMRGAGRAFCAGLDIKEHLGGDRVFLLTARGTGAKRTSGILRCRAGQPVSAYVPKWTLPLTGRF
jgi:enoyl-CoA hydratase/carnithine racemase